MISKRIALEDINEAFADMKTGTVARSVIMFDH
jgi:S-(hydroxymethyl)glutathione dehydrogenase/alcohol dehydrogenase